jgi:hypothetical protein
MRIRLTEAAKEEARRALYWDILAKGEEITKLNDRLADEGLSHGEIHSRHGMIVLAADLCTLEGRYLVGWPPPLPRDRSARPERAFEPMPWEGGGRPSEQFLDSFDEQQLTNFQSCRTISIIQISDGTVERRAGVVAGAVSRVP